jgi:hypothetical protein
LIAAGRFVSAALYDINIFAIFAYRATTYLKGIAVNPAAVAEERDVYESVKVGRLARGPLLCVASSDSAVSIWDRWP